MLYEEYGINRTGDTFMGFQHLLEEKQWIGRNGSYIIHVLLIQEHEEIKVKSKEKLIAEGHSFQWFLSAELKQWNIWVKRALKKFLPRI